MNPGTPSTRFAIIDVLRGSAIAMMIVFHFCFDLTLFGHAQFDFYHSAFWLNFRILIVSLFTFVMGVSLVLAHQQGVHWRRFLRRLLILVACALIITLTTYFTSGERFIYFGILHFIAVASVLAIPFLRLYWGNLIIGVGIILFDMLYQNPLFHHIYLQWIGLMQYKPATDDYAPIIPWFGPVLIGIFCARWALNGNRLTQLRQWHTTVWPVALLRFAGRHSLIIYMLHQPIFFGLFELQSALNR